MTRAGLRAGIVGLSLASLASLTAVPALPCRTEDSVSCYWDGGPNGGRSFTSDHNGTVTFLDNGQTDERIDR